MTRTKSPPRKARPSSEVRPEKARSVVASSETKAHDKIALIAPAVQLGDLAQALKRIDLTPISALEQHIARANGAVHQPPLTLEPSSPRPTMLTSVETLGTMIRARREALNLSQQSFAEQAGVGRRFISELENGKPSLEFDKVLAVARAAGIDLLAAITSPAR